MPVEREPESADDGPSGGLDARLVALLEGPLAWYEVDHRSRVDSTNAIAAQGVVAGAPAGRVVVADHQSAGRGRLDRRWEDVAGGSLLCSMTVALPPRRATLVPLVAGLATADAARRAGAGLRLKWPNDLVDDDDRKAGGILVERHDGPAGPQLVVGVGVNLDWRGVPRTDESAGWMSLAELAGADVDRWGVLADLLRGLDTWLREVLRSPDVVVRACAEACATIGRHVQVHLPDGARVEGRATRLTADGALVVEAADGSLTVSAGDVVHVRPLSRDVGPT